METKKPSIKDVLDIEKSHFLAEEEFVLEYLTDFFSNV